MAKPAMHSPSKLTSSKTQKAEHALREAVAAAGEAVEELKKLLGALLADLFTFFEPPVRERIAPWPASSVSLDTHSPSGFTVPPTAASPSPSALAVKTTPRKPLSVSRKNVRRSSPP